MNTYSSSSNEQYTSLSTKKTTTVDSTISTTYMNKSTVKKDNIISTGEPNIDIPPSDNKEPVEITSDELRGKMEKQLEKVLTIDKVPSYLFSQYICYEYEKKNNAKDYAVSMTMNKL